MKNSLLWKMLSFIAVGTVILFWSIDMLNRQTENEMSFIDKQYQQQIIDYGLEAERLYLSGNQQQLAKWLLDLQAKEQTWAAVVQSNLITMGGSILEKQFTDSHRLGRNVQWKIHLYFKVNPVMDITFADNKTRFLIRLPQRMRPGGYYPLAQVLLQIALPFLLLSLLTWVLYRHVMKPLSALQEATHKFGAGDYGVQINAKVGTHKDEFTTLTNSFDLMASRTGKLIVNQRQLLEDLSHELRTPLARLDMAVDCIKQGIHTTDSIERLSNESAIMRELVEDTLMLVWLNNEMPTLNKDSFDLVELLEVICNDARFEYPQHCIILQGPTQLPIGNSSQRALNQALENIIRNALQHTPTAHQVIIAVDRQNDKLQVTVSDNGPGVPEHLLEDIFQPFFQVDKSRAKQNPMIPLAEGTRRGGFGLGLALAQRQITAVGGNIIANNLINELENSVKGLRISILLPA
ncbi:MAG: histidine kinase sensor domain-containing protein [Oceanospirillaceae bacterium]|nr:histidine kinase sensor domain-containing protein [Oceanospirillaceae bacterium]